MQELNFISINRDLSYSKQIVIEQAVITLKVKQGCLHNISACFVFNTYQYIDIDYDEKELPKYWGEQPILGSIIKT